MGFSARMGLPVGILDPEEYTVCGNAGQNYALGTASILARASEKMNICQQGPALLVGG